MAAARCAAIILAGVYMPKVLTNSKIPRGDVLLLNIGVKGIKQYSDVRVCYRFTKGSGICSSVEKISFKPV